MNTPLRHLKVALLSLLSLSAISIYAESPADAVLDRFVEAAGGVEAIEKLSNMEADIILQMPSAGLVIDMKLKSAHPNKFYTEQMIPSAGVIKQGYNGKMGWSSDPIQGDRLLSSEEIKELTKESSPQWILHIKDRFELRSIAYESESEIALELQEDSNAPAETWVFSKETGLLVAQDRVVDMGMSGKLPVKTTFELYKATNGVLSPHKTTAKNPAFEATMVLQNIQYNTALAPEAFDPPF